MNKIPMTIQGKQALDAELENLKRVERPEIIKAIAEARAHGDLKENAEYHAAKEQQGFIEGRIVELEHKLANAQVIEPHTMQNDGRVIFAATVTLYNLNDESESVYQIVGEDEADIRAQKLSVSSPLGKTMIGRFEGDEIEVSTPSGLVQYEIVKVEYL